MAVGGGAGGGGGRGAGDVRAGGAYFEIVARDKLTSTLDKLGAKAKAFAGFMSKIAAGAVLAAPAAALTSLLGGIDRLSKIEDLTDIFGISAESASRMAYAFEVAGVSIEQLETVFKKLAESNVSGKPLDEHLLDVADGLLAMEAGSLRNNRAVDLLGKQGVNFLRVAGDLRRLMDESPIFSEADIKNAEAINQAWTKIGIQFKSALIPMLEALAPMAEGIALLAKETANFTSATLELGGAFSETWAGIKDAIKGGSLSQALAILVQDMRIIWAGLLLKLAELWRDFIKAIMDPLRKMAEFIGAPVAQIDFIEGINNALVGMAKANVMDQLAVMDVLKGDAADMARRRGGGGGGFQMPAQVSAMRSHVAGGFGGSNLSQRFGYGPEAQLLKNSTDLLNEVKNNLPKKVGQAVADELVVR